MIVSNHRTDKGTLSAPANKLTDATNLVLCKEQKSGAQTSVSFAANVKTTFTIFTMLKESSWLTFTLLFTLSQCVVGKWMYRL